MLNAAYRNGCPWTLNTVSMIPTILADKNGHRLFVIDGLDHRYASAIVYFWKVDCSREKKATVTQGSETCSRVRSDASLVAVGLVPRAMPWTLQCAAEA